MTAVAHEADPPVRLPDEISVLNAGLPLFAEAIAEQGRPVVQLDWRIPGGGDPKVVAALRRLSGPRAAVIDAANAEAYRAWTTGCRRPWRSVPPPRSSRPWTASG